MHHDQKYEVRLCSTTLNERIHEYEAHDWKYEGHPQAKVCFVEARSNQEFELDIALASGFRYYTAPGLKITLSIDNEDLEWTWWKRRPARSVHREQHHRLSTIATPRAAAWQEARLAFGPLDPGNDYRNSPASSQQLTVVDGTTEVSNEEAESQARSHGMIIITIQRCHRRVKQGPLTVVRSGRATVPKATEKLVEKHGLGHYIK